MTDEKNIRRQLLQDFEEFTRRMRLQYIFHTKNTEPHPFHVESDWVPLVQKSVVLESYLESVKIQLAEIKPSNPKNNLSHNEYKALTELVNNTEIILKKADKGTTTVIMNKCDKMQEAQTHLNNREHYKLLKNAMAEETLQRVNELVTRLHQNNFIDDMTKKWFSQTRNPPRIPIFYTLTKIHKQNPVGRPIISGCEGPTERLSSFVDKLLQLIAQTHGTAMGTKVAVAFANIFMVEIETKLINQSNTKPIKWKRHIDDIFSLWDSNMQEINLFIKQANNFHPTIKFTAEISEIEITFLDTIISKGERFRNESILDIRTHYKPTETFQYTHFTSSHPPGVKKGFIKGEALRLLRTNSSETAFNDSITNFKLRLIARCYPHKMIQTTLSEVSFARRQSALQQKAKAWKQILPLWVTLKIYSC